MILDKVKRRAKQDEQVAATVEGGIRLLSRLQDKVKQGGMLECLEQEEEMKIYPTRSGKVVALDKPHLFALFCSFWGLARSSLAVKRAVANPACAPSLDRLLFCLCLGVPLLARFPAL